MGDFPKFDLTRPDGMYPHLADAPCSGCGEPIAADHEHCYAGHDRIWHSRCWPTELATVPPVLPCPVCTGDEERARDEGLPYPWPDDEPSAHSDHQEGRTG